ncbi:protein ANTAGONIST OF LIKE HETEROCHROMATIN PROTEIN 1-like [Haliotis rubra]|uniref:protein ANTAGONIST OF LIKE HETEROCHROMATIN PROTEIN 1-like n=1 Tax=Haliotis rubra TaxID=36100 RepID=UPI001EE60525|nr:protein ANTAGONIST OF LIKE HETEROCHROMATIN PROTEIN 1-like [Haliotis rubra]
MDSSSEEETLAMIMLVHISQSLKKKRKPKSVWVRNWILRRNTAGAYNSLLRELEQEDPRSLKNFLRMDKANFDILLEKISPYIEKKCTPMRNSIPVGEKLALTLRYLASGDSYSSLQFLYRVPRNTICNFVPCVCKAIYDVPTTERNWRNIQEEFMAKWQFPHCIGAIDGKHIAIRAPNNTGSEFFNYKKFFNIILLALVDANCKFIFVDVGANGRAGDAAVYANSQLSYALQHNTLNTPQPTPLEGRHELVPSVVVGDDAFQLKPHLMKPYPMRDLSYEKRVFNYRLSRARRVSENAFGLLVNRFCIFQKPPQVSPEVASSVVLASVS